MLNSLTRLLFIFALYCLVASPAWAGFEAFNQFKATTLSDVESTNAKGAPATPTSPSSAPVKPNSPTQQAPLLEPLPKAPPVQSVPPEMEFQRVPGLHKLLADLGEAPMDEASMRVLSDDVQQKLDAFAGPKRAYFQRALTRGYKYQPMIRTALKEVGLPEDLAWLPLIESGFHYRAKSQAGALGLWQFMPDTARFHAMQVARGEDERLDPVRATLAAREYLRDRLNALGNDQVLLAAATYNAGEGRVRLAMQRTGMSHFVAVKQALPQETRDYVPLFLAAALIARDPAAYGFDDSAKDDGIVQLRLRQSLAQVAESQGVELQTLRALNDDLTTGNDLPPVTNFFLRLPAQALQDGAESTPNLLVWRNQDDDDRQTWRSAMVLPAFDQAYFSATPVSKKSVRIHKPEEDAPPIQHANYVVSKKSQRPEIIKASFSKTKAKLGGKQMVDAKKKISAKKPAKLRVKTNAKVSGKTSAGKTSTGKTKAFKASAKKPANTDKPHKKIVAKNAQTKAAKARVV